MVLTVALFGVVELRPAGTRQSLPNLIAIYMYFSQLHIQHSLSASRAMIYPSTAGVYSSEIFVARLNDGRTGPMVTPYAQPRASNK